MSVLLPGRGRRWPTNVPNKSEWQRSIKPIISYRLLWPNFAARMQKRNDSPIPYPFVIDEDDSTTFAFETNHQLVYEVRFKHTGYIFVSYPELELHAFELIIRLVSNSTGNRTPLDTQIAATIAGIVRSFLARTERVIIYICDSSDLRQVTRARKFDTWYEYYRGIDFIKINRNIIDPSGEVYLTALIMRHDNPLKVRIFEAFDRLTSGQAEDKP